MRYNYDISKIEEMANKGYSIRKIARHHGWDERCTQSWINRNFIKSVRYIRKNK